MPFVGATRALIGLAVPTARALSSTLWTVLGSAVIVVSTLYLARSEARAKRDVPPPVA